MKAVILLCTLKKEGLSNTQVLSEFFSAQLQKRNVECEIIKLVNHNIATGTYTDMGAGDEWPGILQKIIHAEIIVFATPIWWGNHSSIMQRAVERLDHLHDEIIEGKKSQLDGKVGGVIITGDSDGAQQVISNIYNFLSAVGVVLPPYVSLSVLWEGQAKGNKTTREELMKKYEEEYTKSAETMADQLLKYAGN